MLWRRGWNNPQNATVLKSSIETRARKTREDRNKTPLERFTSGSGMHQIGVLKLARIFHSGSKGKVRVAKKGKYLKLQTMPLPQKYITNATCARQSPTAQGLMSANWKQSRDMVAASTLSAQSRDHYETPWKKADSSGFSQSHFSASSMYNQSDLAPVFGVDYIDQTAMLIRKDVIETHLPFSNSSMCGPNRSPYPSVRDLSYFGLATSKCDGGGSTSLPHHRYYERIFDADPRVLVRGCALAQGTDIPRFTTGKYLQPAHGMRVGSAMVCGGYGPGIVSWLASGDIEPSSTFKALPTSSSVLRGGRPPVVVAVPTGGVVVTPHPSSPPSSPFLLKGGYFMDFGRRWRRFVLHEDGNDHEHVYFPKGGPNGSTPAQRYKVPSLVDRTSLEVNVSSTPSAAIAQAHRFLSTLSPAILLALPAASLRYLIETVAAVGCPGMEGTDAALILAVTEQWHEFTTSPLQQLELLRCMSIIATTYATQVAGYSGAGRVVTGDAAAPSPKNPNESLRSTITRFLVFSAELFPPKLWQTLPSLLSYFGSRGLVLEVLELLDLSMLWVGDTLPLSYASLLETVGRGDSGGGGGEQELLSFFPNSVSGTCEATAPFSFFKDTCGLGRSSRSYAAILGSLRQSAAAATTPQHQLHTLSDSFLQTEHTAILRAHEDMGGGRWWDASLLALTCFEVQHSISSFPPSSSSHETVVVADVPLLRGAVHLSKVVAEVLGGLWSVGGSSKGSPIPLARRVDSLEWAVTLMSFLARIVKVAGGSAADGGDESLPLFGYISDILRELAMLSESMVVAAKLVLTSSLGKGASGVVEGDILRAVANKVVGPRRDVNTANTGVVDVTILSSSTTTSTTHHITAVSRAIGAHHQHHNRVGSPQDAVAESLATGQALPRLRRQQHSSTTDASTISSPVPMVVASLQPTSVVFADRINPFQLAVPDLHRQLIRLVFEEAIPVLVHLAALCAERLLPGWSHPSNATDASARTWNTPLLQEAIESLQAIDDMWEFAAVDGLKLEPPASASHLLVHPNDLNTVRGVLECLQSFVGGDLCVVDGE